MLEAENCFPVALLEIAFILSEIIISYKTQQNTGISKVNNVAGKKTSVISFFKFVFGPYFVF